MAHSRRVTAKPLRPDMQLAAKVNHVFTHLERVLFRHLKLLIQLDTPAPGHLVEFALLVSPSVDESVARGSENSFVTALGERWILDGQVEWRPNKMVSPDDIVQQVRRDDVKLRRLFGIQTQDERLVVRMIHPFSLVTLG